MIERRDFLGALAGLGAVPLVSAAPPLPREPWDLSWLDRLKGKHKQVFDLSDMGNGLGVVRNWLDAHETVLGLRHPQVNAVVGIAGRAFPINAGDALYQAYPIGEVWKLTDPDTGKPPLRNIFLEGGKQPPELGVGVRPLQARGAIFWQCNNALQFVVRRLEAALGRSEPGLYEKVRAGLNPGVIVIPAHTMLLGLCQERGCSYEAI